ncbi:MAG: RdgB/HAM1 family non-canonical purine NTP pyrophosphatase [Deltaproteobacteria bacterium]|jgi:XTP/dITP diphosphohydrolase|nr:RdgB/HAM1 family non-canonical purine NTP pyrophosphatase [Deltaproteobacteria bacterium]
MQELWIATTNRGKLLEFEMCLDGLVKEGKIKLKTLDDLDTYYPPEETGGTFLDNARIKARSLKAMNPGKWIVAEDSGLAVEGMGGLPGVHSARYAGPKASDFENRAKLLKIMGLKQLTNRNAAFLCQMVVFSPEAEEFVFAGQLNGTIAKAEAGKTGFGYDSVFVPEGENKTLAELGLAFKNKVSHRARAVEKLLELLHQKL